MRERESVGEGEAAANIKQSPRKTNFRQHIQRQAQTHTHIQTCKHTYTHTQRHSQRTAREQGEKARKLHSTSVEGKEIEREREAVAGGERSAATTSARAAELQAASARVFFGPRECDEEEAAAQHKEATQRMRRRR